MRYTRRALRLPRNYYRGSVYFLIGEKKTWKNWNLFTKLKAWSGLWEGPEEQCRLSFTFTTTHCSVYVSKWQRPHLTQPYVSCFSIFRWYLESLWKQMVKNTMFLHIITVIGWSNHGHLGFIYRRLICCSLHEIFFFCVKIKSYIVVLGCFISI